MPSPSPSHKVAYTATGVKYHASNAAVASPGGRDKSLASGSDWLRVTKSEPCPVCGKQDWCLVSVDGSAAICQRVQSDREIGRAGWLHRLADGDAPANLPRRDKAHDVAKAGPGVLDAVYRALLAELSLSQAHSDALASRGILPADIQAGLYRSLPRSGRTTLAAKLTKQVHDGVLPVMAGVPGFYMVTGDYAYPNLSGASGLLVPVKDVQGRIVGLQVRSDNVTSGGRYRWISSPGKFGGSSSGSPVHVAGQQLVGDYLVVTEGPLKADIVSRRLGCLVLGVAGVSNWSGVLDAVRSLGVRSVIMAFDMDKVGNAAVKHHNMALTSVLVKDGLSVYDASWPASSKGLDDFLCTRGLYVQHIAKLTLFEAKLRQNGVLLSPVNKQKAVRRRPKSSREKAYSKHYNFVSGKGWLAWRKYLEGRHMAASLDCLQYGRQHQCSEHEHVVWEPMLCGDWHRCVICGFRYEQIQAESAMAKFDAVAAALPGVEVLRMVFTLPRELWPRVSWSKFGEFSKLANATLYEYFGGQPAGEFNLHYWHSAKPLPEKDGWYPHIHAAVLNVVRSVDGQYLVVPAFLDALRLKTIWARRVAKHFKLKFRQFESKEGKTMPQLKLKQGWRTVNLRLAGYVPVDNSRYEYTRGKRKGTKAAFSNRQYLKARLRYDFRLPQGDIADYGDKAGLESFSSAQKMAIDAFLGRDLPSGARYGRPKNFRRERWFGWLADGVVRARLAELGTQVLTAKGRKDAAKAAVAARGPVSCPVHGCNCSGIADNFGRVIPQSRWSLVVGDVMLSANYRQDKRFWLITDEIYDRWHPLRTDITPTREWAFQKKLVGVPMPWRDN